MNNKNIKCNRRDFMLGGSALMGYACLPNLGIAKPSLVPLTEFYKNLNHLAVSSHRGGFQTAPENTIASLQTCIDWGAEMTEIDVRATSDGIPIVFHDAELNRMMGKDIELHTLSYEQLKTMPQYDKGGLPGNPLTEHTVPTLEETLDYAKGKIYVRLDIKDKTVKDKIGAIVRNAGMEEYAKIHRSIKKEKDLDKIKKAQDYYGCFIVPHMNFKERYLPRLLPRLIPIFDNLGTNVLSAKFDSFTALETVMPYLNERNIKLEVNTLKFSYSVVGHYDTSISKGAEALWGPLHSAGVDVIMTDHLKEIITWRKEKGIGKP